MIGHLHREAGSMRPSRFRASWRAAAGFAFTLSLVLALAGCAPYPVVLFTVGGASYEVPEAEIDRLQGYWIEPTRDVLRASTTNWYDRRFVLVSVARVHADLVAEGRRCTKLALTGLRRLPLDEIHEATAAGTVEVLRPVYFAELWDVEACGRRATWRALGLWGRFHITHLPAGRP